MKHGCGLLLAFALLAQGQQGGTEDRLRNSGWHGRARGQACHRLWPAFGGTGDALDGDTVFEISSITKAVTGMLLADMVRRGEVGLDDASQRTAASARQPEARR